jgi:hypothetical protein
VKRRRIEVGIIRPDQSADFRVEPDGIEVAQVLERPKERPLQHRPEVDALLGAVIERHEKRVWPDDAEPSDPVNGMRQDLPEWVDLDGRLPGLQELPIVLQLRAVDLGPGLDEALLRFWQASGEVVNRVDGKHRRVLLVERMEMWAAVLRASLDEHPDNDPEEPREFWHL